MFTGYAGLRSRVLRCRMTEQLGSNAADVAFLVGIAQCGLIYYGLLRMEKTGQRRDAQLDRQAKVLEDIGAGIREQSAPPDNECPRTQLGRVGGARLGRDGVAIGEVMCSGGG